MFIETEITPNPATLKFRPGRPVMTFGTLDIRSEEGAGQSPLARALFTIDGISGVFLWLRLHFGHEIRRRLAGAQTCCPRRHHGAFSLGRAVA